MQYAGARVREKITWQPVRAVDAVGGAALSAVAVLLVAWALGYADLRHPDRGGHRAGPRVLGARQGQRGAARLRRRRCRRSTRWSAPASSRATSSPSRPSGSSTSVPVPTAEARPAGARDRGQHPQDPRRQRLRPRRRGHRLRLRPEPGDDQRPRRRRRRRPGGRDRRHRAGAASCSTTPSSTSPSSASTPATRRPCSSTSGSPRTRSRSSAIRRTARSTSSPAGSVDNPTALARHLRLRHRAPRRLLPARPGPAGQLRRPDHHRRAATSRRGVRRVGQRPRHRLRADRRQVAKRPRRAGVPAVDQFDTGDCRTADASRSAAACWPLRPSGSPDPARSPARARAPS